jgi:hypothetical protein
MQEKPKNKIKSSPGPLNNQLKSKQRALSAIYRLVTTILLVLPLVVLNSTSAKKTSIEDFMQSKSTQHHSLKGVISSKLDKLSTFDDAAIKKRLAAKKLAKILDPVFAIQKMVKSFVFTV